MMDVKGSTVKEGKLGGYGLRHAVFEVKKKEEEREERKIHLDRNFARVARTESRGMQMFSEST